MYKHMHTISSSGNGNIAIALQEYLFVSGCPCSLAANSRSHNILYRSVVCSITLLLLEATIAILLHSAQFEVSRQQRMDSQSGRQADGLESDSASSTLGHECRPEAATEQQRLRHIHTLQHLPMAKAVQT